ncbi:hypothetical protein VT84_10070 [Gemmata sp. SH-PL17]|uniref:hypothetical protein n=1 Tax=Gemmata sp. SH-PL17 TaxID=1630693 RepID=UPI00078B8367|nr:hypothetical protein [Gemmata sp. SH-PL17]AMV24731.1 hypothetical protein VT84_10070 [Gemmata sp. SH-PL17]
MTEMLVSCAVVIASAVGSGAPPQPQPETLIRLTVDATRAPKPALKYLLLPEIGEMTQGNPIPNYLKCVLDQESKGTDAPLSRLALKQVDRAARMDKPDWQILPKLKTDGVSLLLPDVQKMRQLANELNGRFRDEVALRRFDDAIVTAKTMFALARHMGEHPTLIGGLVAVAIATVAIAPLEEMIGQPGCPNLYWALTALPHPFVPLDKGLEGERVFVGTELRELDDTNPMTAAQLRKLMTHLDRVREIQRNEKKTGEWLAERAKDEKNLVAARARLQEHGLRADRLALFSPYQVLLLEAKLDYEIQRDETMKYAPLPTWEALAYIDKVPVPKETPLFSSFLSSLYSVRRAQGRLEQRLALLRHVEALRLHAADHEGKLPQKLSEVAVPLPVDPFSGKPFRYELVDGVGHLRGSPPKAGETNAVYHMHYEIIIRK